MELTPNTLEKITMLAEAAFPPWKVAFMLGIDADTFKQLIEDISHPVSVAYYTGFHSNELAVRTSIMKLARDGSSPAQAEALRMIEHTKTALRLHDYKSIDTGE